jgi:glutathione S-transferase
MSAKTPIKLVGGIGSPYTRKMVALLRYRHIPYEIIWGDPSRVLSELGVKTARINLLPTFLFKDDNGQLEAVCDSTPIIRRLESEYSQRSVIPTDPVVRFIDFLLEDFADEWCTKYMFHYRWQFSEDEENAATLLPLMTEFSMSKEQALYFKEFVAQRQKDRLFVVGSSATTAPIIDASYRRLLKVLEAHFEQQSFLLGQRPSAADFALYGQLTQLIGFDPTPSGIAHSLSPRAVAYTALMEDQSGHPAENNGWLCMDQLPDTIKQILKEVGRVYVPALLANAAAQEAGNKDWQTEIDGTEWSQRTFPYQAKCLQWIRQEYQCLDRSDRQRVKDILNDTNCDRLLN